MKIICKNKKEYNELMKACQMIHDFTVWIDYVGKKEKAKIRISDIWDEIPESIKTYYAEKEDGVWKNTITDDIDGICFPFDKNAVTNLLAGLHDCADKEIRNDWIEIKKEDNKKLWFPKGVEK